MTRGAKELLHPFSRLSVSQVARELHAITGTREDARSVAQFLVRTCKDEAQRTFYSAVAVFLSNA